MTPGMIFLVLAYVLSQFYRAFLAVLSPVLGVEIGAGAEDLAMASGLWFVTFAAMQIPVGWALDHIGPRLTSSVLLAIGGAGGAAIMAMAQGPGWVAVAMMLIGVGCSPVLMASYYILARDYPAAVFATFAGVILGTGSLGNIGAALPLAWAVESLGWRETMWGMAAVTLMIAAALALFVRNPAKADHSQKGSLLDLLKIPALWFILAIMFVNYAPAAGIRGLWIAPYLEDVYQAEIGRIGTASLVMGFAMIAGNFFYGPLDRVFGTRKWVIFAGNLVSGLSCLALWAWPDGSEIRSIAVMAAVGFFGATFPVIIAHGRSFVPPHLVGRGVTLLNLFGIGGVGIMQFASGPVFARLSLGATPAEAYSQLFGLFGLMILLGCVVYLFSTDRTG
ncbi:MFS transporter [Nioella sp.]|uniref:MFS transporter n=1 Tax=Nioella sp. TaxID=1912091 RepID=UPI003B51AA69